MVNIQSTTNSEQPVKISSREKTFAYITHLSSLFGLISFIITLVYISLRIIIQYKIKSSYDFMSLFLIFIPVVVNAFIPLVMGRIFRRTRIISYFVNEHCKQCLNFQLSVTLYFIISVISVFIAIGVIFLFVLIMFDVASVVAACKKAIQGEAYRYPLAIIFVR